MENRVENDDTHRRYNWKNINPRPSRKRKMIAYKTAHTRTCNKCKQQYTQRIDGVSSKYVEPLNQGNLHKHKSRTNKRKIQGSEPETGYLGQSLWPVREPQRHANRRNSEHSEHNQKHEKRGQCSQITAENALLTSQCRIQMAQLQHIKKIGIVIRRRAVVQFSLSHCLCELL